MPDLMNQLGATEGVMSRSGDCSSLQQPKRSVLMLFTFSRTHRNISALPCIRVYWQPVGVAQWPTLFVEEMVERKYVEIAKPSIEKAFAVLDR